MKYVVCFLMGNSAYEIQTPRNYPEESIQHSEHGESLKSRIIEICYKLRHVQLAFKTGRTFNQNLITLDVFDTLSVSSSDICTTLNSFSVFLFVL